MAGGLATASVLVALAGCATWKPVGAACVRESRDPELRRVVNYTDPELCGRTVKERSSVHLRVPAPKAG
ncbi:MAG: hypothetical protein HY423_09020 [Candidatus Lambdaproteobacteria bacterium]|nr:hypothetical protein [Candidatus Lambdaproteobacteria bacterium]